MRLVWLQRVSVVFTVRDVHRSLDELAYTTVMTTVARLAEKGLLGVEEIAGRAYQYRAAMSPSEYLADMGAREVADLIARFGDVAIAAFERRIEHLEPGQRRSLRRPRR